MTKRANGESSIVKGDDGRFHGYVSMGLKEGGKRDRRHVAAVKRTDVVRMVRELEEQRDAGVVLPSGRGVSVEQWMNTWLDTIASRKVRPSTLAGYRTCLRTRFRTTAGGGSRSGRRPVVVGRGECRRGVR